MGLEMIDKARPYRPIPPLLVMRVRNRARHYRYGWWCRVCGDSFSFFLSQRWPRILTWREAHSYALAHLRTAHGCPSMRASGEPCDSHCADCGGRMWIK